MVRIRDDLFLRDGECVPCKQGLVVFLIDKQVDIGYHIL